MNENNGKRDWKYGRETLREFKRMWEKNYKKLREYLKKVKRAKKMGEK